MISTPSSNDVTVLYKLQQETGYIARGYLNPNKFPVLPSLPHTHTNTRTHEYLLQNWSARRKFKRVGIQLALKCSTSKQPYLSRLLITININ